MVVKVYISRISGNKEIKERQHCTELILQGKNIPFELIDIAEDGNKKYKDFMQSNAIFKGGTSFDPNPPYPLPPQIFNDEEYCGDYEKFLVANETNQLEVFLKLKQPETDEQLESKAEINLENGANCQEQLERES